MAAIGPAPFRLTSSTRSQALLPRCRRMVVGSTEMKFPDARRFTRIWIEIAVTMERGHSSLLRRNISATMSPRYEPGGDSLHFFSHQILQAKVLPVHRGMIFVGEDGER